MSMVYNASKLRLLAKISSLTLAACAFSVSALEFSSPTPGTRITNTAEVHYIEGDNFGLIFTSPSNTATVVTAADYGLNLEADQFITAASSQSVSFPHRLTNLGNTDDVFDLVATNLTGDDGDLTSMTIALDTNGNGVQDAGEPTITQTPSVAAGEIINLVLTGQVPASAQPMDEFAVSLRATSVGNALETDLNNDLVTIIEGALLRFTKTSSQVCSVPVSAGDSLTYDIVWTNSGDQNPLERSHSVDGASITGVMIEDRLSADVNLIAGQTISYVPFAGRVVVMTKTGVSSQQWISYDNWDGVSKVARVGLLVPASELRPSQSGTMSIDVRVASSVTLNSTINNQVVVDEDGDGTIEFASAKVCNTTAGPKAKIRFLSPTFDNIRNQIAPVFENDADFSDTLRYRFQRDANYNPTFDGVYVELDSTSIPEGELQFLEDGTRQAIVQITSSLTGESIPVLVRETDLGSGTFRSTNPVVLSRVSTGDGSLCGDISAAPDYLSVPPAQCNLLSGIDDKLTVSFFDGGLGEVIDDASIVDPLGFVFDAITLEPVAGAEVRVYNAVDNGAGGLQDELANDPFAPPGTPLVIQFTDETGFYQYPFMFAGSYYMQVILTPDSGYAWPSTRNPLLYPGTDVSDFSYGRDGFEGAVIDSGVFVLDADNPIVSIDFPVDPVELDLVVDGTVSCDADLTTDDPIVYSTTFANSGNLVPPERDILIDGLPRTGVVVESLIPLATILDAAVTPTFSPASAELILKLYDGSAVDSWVDYDTWIAQDPADRLLVRSIGLLVPQADLEPSGAVGVLGEGGDLSYGVRIVGEITAGTKIVNQVTVDLNGDGIADILSDEDFQDACETAAGPDPVIRFLQPDNNGAAPEFEVDDHFDDTSHYLLSEFHPEYGHTLDGAYVELKSTSISSDDFVLLDNGLRRIEVLITSELTGDSVVKVLQETEYASGIYRSLLPLVIHASDTGNNEECGRNEFEAEYIDDPTRACVLTSAPNDTLTATFLHRFESDDSASPAPAPEVELFDIAYVAPQGFVFLSNDPFDTVGGAILRFYRVTGAGTAEVVGDPILTESDGSFSFPEFENGDYYIEVEDTDEFTFASDVSLAELQATSGYTLSAFSYGNDDGNGIFTISDANPVYIFDVPVDLSGISAELVVRKDVNLPEVEIGGLLEYSVSVSNIGDRDASQVAVLDRLPFGFKYIENTLRQDGVLIADPSGVPAPELTFDVGTLPAGETSEFLYVLQATAGALDSDGINIAQANGYSGLVPVTSNEARVQVEIGVSGVLSDKGIIFGKIYVDADCNNIQSDGEWPIGGVAVYLEDGTYAITDENGQYSIYGINPGIHSLKLDEMTLPEGLHLKPIDNRNLADPDSRVVDLLNGEFHRADFAAACPDPAEADMVYAQVAERNSSIEGDWLTANSASFDVFERALARAALESDDLSSGTILSSSQLDSSSALVSPAQGIYGGIDITATSEEEVEAAVVIDEIIYEIDSEEGKAGMWLWPKDDVSLHGRFAVAVRDRVVADLYVNGEIVSRNQLGEESHNTATDVQALAWYGVRLANGENLVEVKTTDLFGNERVLLSKTFVSPSQAVELVVEPEEDVIAADGGRSTVPIKISVKDASGYEARGMHFLTIEVSDGRILGQDLQLENPGFQIRLDRGSKTVQLQSPQSSGELEIRVSNDEFDESVFINTVAAQRSLLVSGIASASAGFCDLDSEGYAPTAEDCTDGMQENRAALFMKGSVRGNMFLTLSYDSDKVADGELLRDINPDEYYPIFGDSSIRGYEAQSRSKLFAKLEMDRSFVQWGDFSTDRSTNFQDLGRVQRSLTGFSAELVKGDLQAEVFAAEVEDINESIEIPGNGTAMLFSIPAAPIIRNSEVIELIVRDRDNTGLVISSENLTRFVDYTVDHLTGDIRFTRTIPTIDANLNPVSLRISYDVEGNGEADLIAGVRANYQLTDDLIAGGAYTEDENEVNGYDLTSGFVEYKPSDNSRVFVSTATMNHSDTTRESGSALYAQLEMNWEGGSNSNLQWGRADAGFTNNGAGVSADREELRAKHSQTLSETLTLDAELIRSESLSAEESRQSMELGVDYSVGDWILSLGGRRIEQDSEGNPTDDANTIVAGAGRSFTVLGKRGNIDLGLEREIGDQDRKRWMIGTSLQAHEKLSLYGNFEQVNSLTGPSALSSEDETIRANFGFESDFLPSTSVFSEYRMRGVTDGRDLEAASGVRGDYAIREGLTITPSVEWIDVLEGATGQDSVALSLGIEDLRNQNARTLARIETRFDDTREYYGLDISYVSRVSLDWSSFVREEFTYTAVEDADNDMSHELTLGLTHRPRENNKYHALFMYQWQETRGANLLDDHSQHLLSTHQNYQFNDKLRVSGRLGAKYETTPLLDEDFSSLTAVMDGRLIWDFTRRLDLDVHAGVMGTNSFEENRYSFGIGLNFLVMQGLRVGVGYNLTGFDEGDLDTEGFNRQGIYLHAEYKFDEDMFHWLESDLYRREEAE